MNNETESNILIISLLFFLILFICGLASLISYYFIIFLRDKLKWKWKYLSNKYLVIILTFSSISFSFYEAYIAVYPNDNFYFQEFEYVTNKKIPNSGKIILKESSYPDIHGDYFSKSIIELSEEDFMILIEKIENDKSMIQSDNDQINDFKVFERKIKGEEDRSLFIRFLNDHKRIVINVNFT